MSGKYTQPPGGVFVPGEQYTYESAELFLSMVQAEYQNEIDRAAALDSKMGISLPVISAYFFLIVQDNKVKEFWQVSYNSTCAILALSFYFCAVLASLWSLFQMSHALMRVHLQSVNMEEFYTAKELSRTKERFSAIIATSYLQAVKTNRKENNRKAEKYQSGWISGVCSLFCFFLYILFALLSIGRTI